MRWLICVQHWLHGHFNFVSRISPPERCKMYAILSWTIWGSSTDTYLRETVSSNKMERMKNSESSESSNKSIYKSAVWNLANSRLPIKIIIMSVVEGLRTDIMIGLHLERKASAGEYPFNLRQEQTARNQR